MSIEIMNNVWKFSKSTGRARLVLLAIADHQGEIGAWPSIETLARMVNASPRSVQRDIQELVKLGELVVEVQNAPTKNQYKSNLYWVALSGVTDSASGVTKNESGVTDSASGVTELASGVTPVGVLNLNRTITETLINNYPKNEFENEFIQFWNSYPRKEGKESAKKAFKKALEKVDFDTLLAGTIRMAHDPNLPPKQYIKHPASWLNAGGWDDEPFPERVLTREEQLEREAVKNRAIREKDILAAKQVMQESAEKRKKSVPPPQCKHGKSIISCRQCLFENR